MKQRKLSATEMVMLQRLEEKPSRSCYGCNKMGCNTCGHVEYEVVTSSSGRWMKHPDERCEYGYGF